MTVASTTNRKTYTGDNVTTSFATSPVIFYATSDLQVRVTVIATGVSTLLTLNTHYSVSGGSATGGATGTVNLAGGSSPHGALLSTEKLVILRVLPLTQASDFVNNSNSDAEVLEAALDKLTDVDQQIQEQADRAIRFASGDVSGSVTEIPDVTTRALKTLGFDSDGKLTTILMAVGGSLINLATSIGSSLVGFIQTGSGAVARTMQDKARDVVALADFDLLASYNTAIAALGSSGKYSFAGSINFPGADQLRQITWNTGDIILYRNGLGRFGLQLKPDGTNDSALDISTTLTSGQGSNRLRIWSYDGLGSTAQWYTEITTDRDVGFEGTYIANRVTGGATPRPIFFQTGTTPATQFKISDLPNAVQFIEVLGAAAGVGRPAIRGNGSDAAIGILFAGKGTTADFLFQTDFLGTPVNQFQILAGAGASRWLTVTGSTTNPVLDATAGAIKLSSGTADIQWGKANVALGGGAAPTVGTIGGSGPAAAAQRNWLRFIESDGTASFIPVWR